MREKWCERRYNQNNKGAWHFCWLQVRPWRSASPCMSSASAPCPKWWWYSCLILFNSTFSSLSRSRVIPSLHQSPFQKLYPSAEPSALMYLLVLLPIQIRSFPSITFLPTYQTHVSSLCLWVPGRLDESHFPTLIPSIPLPRFCYSTFSLNSVLRVIEQKKVRPLSRHITSRLTPGFTGPLTSSLVSSAEQQSLFSSSTKKQ